MALDEQVKQQIEAMVRDNKVMLFMKGNKSFPQCGFSATVVGILKELKVPFETTNVLTDPSIRDGIKLYSDWPTIPQLYIGGEFVGGCDIIREMYETGELAKMVGAKWDPPKAPNVTITKVAAKAFLDAKEPGDTDKLRLEINSQFAVDLYFGPEQKGDFKIASNGVDMLVDPGSATRADGIVVDYIEGPDGAGFKIENPNEPPRVKQITPQELKAMLDAKDAVHLFDVRPEKERALAKLEVAISLDAEGEKKLGALGKGDKVVLHCHHGGRSQAAAERLITEGFTNVYNLRGGIDAWSQTVDTKIPRY